MGTSAEPQSRQVLEFLTVTGGSKSGRRGADDEESRRIVRSHAIRDANRRKKYSPDSENKNIQGGAPTKPLPQSNFTAKFRLNQKPRRKINLDAVEGSEDVDKSLEALSKQIKSISRYPKSVPVVPGASRFDPFDTLPVTIGPREQALIEWQNKALSQNAFAFYSKARLFSFASADPAWLNATLSLISLNYDLKLGRGISRECLVHRGEALRIVNERLSKSPREISDHTIGAIASLANFDTTNGLYPSATMHIQGLVYILSNRGTTSRGLWALTQNELLQKIVAWSDLCYATTWDLPPKFPILRTDYCSASLTEYLSLFSSKLNSPDLTSLHDLFGEMTEIFQALRLLSICMARPFITTDEQALFTRGLYITEYKLLVVLDQTDPRDDDIVLSRNSHIYGSCRLAAYIYLYLMLRELPRTAEINYTLARRLKGVMGAGNLDLMVVWKDDLYMLLWIATMGALVTYGSVEGAYFIDILKKLRPRLGLNSFAVFQDALKQVLWMNDKCWERGLATFWALE